MENVKENVHKMLIEVEEGKEDYEVARWIGGDGTIVHGVVIKLAGDHAKNKKFIRNQRHICPICFDDYTSNGNHRICCLPCGHVYGMSCIKQWLERKDEACDKCPLCKKSCSVKDIKVLYANCLEVATAVDQKLHKSSARRFPFTNKGVVAFKRNTVRQRKDTKKLLATALKFRDDALRRQTDALKWRRHLYNILLEAFSSGHDVLDHRLHAMKQGADALEREAGALGRQANAMEQLVNAFTRRDDAYKKSLHFVDQMYKEHTARSARQNCEYFA